MIPESLADQISLHIKKVKNLHKLDLEKGFGETILPKALARKYPGAAKEFGWQYLFPSKKISRTAVRYSSQISYFTTGHQAGGTQGSGYASYSKTCNTTHVSSFVRYTPR